MNDDFKSRNASSRTYLYRLAVYNHEKPLVINDSNPKLKNLFYSYAFYQNAIESSYLVEIRFIFNAFKHNLLK